MAVITRYVNTASTAGSQDGTTNNAGNSGTAAYESLSKWNTAEATDIDTPGNQHIVNCSGTAADTVGDVQITGWTTSVVDNVTINGDSDDEHTYSTSHYRLEHTFAANYGEGFNFDDSNFVINDIQAQGTNTSYPGCRLFYCQAEPNSVFRCIAKGVLSGGWTYGFAQGDGVIRSCLAFDFHSVSTDAGFRYSGSGSGGIKSDSNTAHNCYSGHWTSYKHTDGRNLLAQDCTVGFEGTWNSADSCASDIGADAPGTNTQTGNVLFTNEAADDFELSASDTVARGNGADLSGTFNFDLANNTMPASWPIGCMQQAGAGNNPHGPFGHPLTGAFGGPI